MLHRVKYVASFLAVLLIVFGCQTPIVNMVNPDGETTPKPFYRAKTTNGSHLTFTWFYVKYEGVKDVDKSTQYMPTYLDVKKKHDFLITKVHSAKMVLRVFNPLEQKYKVYLSQKFRYRHTGDSNSYTLQGTSKLQYREWTFDIPINKHIRKGSVLAEVHGSKNLLMRSKRFQYANLR